MIERLALVVFLTVAAAGAYHALRALHVRRMRPSAAGEGVPALLYFRSDSCAVCPTQGRFVDQLATQWDDRVRVEWVDAERDPETASRYNVFTLPTTIWIDGDGRVRQVNYGLTDAGKLGRQAAELLEQSRDAVEGRKMTDHRPRSEELSSVVRGPSSAA